MKLLFASLYFCFFVLHTTSWIFSTQTTFRVIKIGFRLAVTRVLLKSRRNCAPWGLKSLTLCWTKGWWRPTRFCRASPNQSPCKNKNSISNHWKRIYNFQDRRFGERFCECGAESERRGAAFEFSTRWKSHWHFGPRRRPLRGQTAAHRVWTRPWSRPLPAHRPRCDEIKSYFLKLILLLMQTDFGIRMIYANLWLFKDLLGSLMTKHPLTNTIVKTSTGLVRFNSGIKVVFRT